MACALPYLLGNCDRPGHPKAALFYLEWWGMMARHWIKLWVEMLSDPKVARLPDQQYRKFIEVLLLAGYKDDCGKLPPIMDIAWMLHLSESETEAALQSLVKVGLIHKDGNDWIVTNFDKRQETPAAERMRRMRSKQKEQESEQLQRNSYGNSYGADSASASASLINIKKNNEIYGLYEAEIGTITKSIADKLTAAWDEYPHEWFPVAFDEAVRNNARKWAYVEAILKNWKAHGFQSKNGRHTTQSTGGVKRTGAIAAARAELESEKEKRNGKSD